VSKIWLQKALHLHDEGGVEGEGEGGVEGEGGGGGKYKLTKSHSLVRQAAKYRFSVYC